MTSRAFYVSLLSFASVALLLLVPACEKAAHAEPPAPVEVPFEPSESREAPESREPTPPPSISSFDDLGPNITGRMEDGVAITEGVVRVRRRHENDMDFAKYNPFYWEGRLTTFKVEDFTPGGENKIRFSLFTEWPQDYTKYRGPDFSAIYTGDPRAHETLRSKFAINVRMKHLGGERKHFEATIDEGAFNVHADALKIGELLTFEYRFFNDEQHPGWAKQKKRNGHNLSAYYSEFFRIEIGKPGLFIDAFTEDHGHPSPKRYTGGHTTIPTVRVEPWGALQQQAFNLTPGNAQTFLTGRTWFHTDFQTGRHVSDTSDDKPSVFFEDDENERADFSASAYNQTSCNQCHFHNGRALLPEIGEAIHTTVAKTSASSPHGVQLQTDGDDAEGELTITRHETKTVKLDDGTEIELSKPIFAINGEETPASIRNTPALIGAGLLDAIPTEDLEARAAATPGTFAGRFGWKAEQPTLQAQIRDALNRDMGVTSAGHTDLDGAFEAGKENAPEYAVDMIETYVALLGVPPRNEPEHADVLAGETLFNQIGCASCHTPRWRTGKDTFPELQNQVIQPYTDLLLHDMGDGLADSTSHAANDSSKQTARLWRTAPLWGLKNTRDATHQHRDKHPPGNTEVTYIDTWATSKTNPVQLLHDGRARSIPEAILWHGGEAQAAVDAYKALNKTERDQLERFLWDL